MNSNWPRINTTQAWVITGWSRKHIVALCKEGLLDARKDGESSNGKPIWLLDEGLLREHALARGKIHTTPAERDIPSTFGDAHKESRGTFGVRRELQVQLPKPASPLELAVWYDPPLKGTVLTRYCRLGLLAATLVIPPDAVYKRYRIAPEHADSVWYYYQRHENRNLNPGLPTVSGDVVPSGLMTAKQAAEYLQISPSTVRAHTRTGRLESLDIEGVQMYTRDAINAWKLIHGPGKYGPRTYLGRYHLLLDKLRAVQDHGGEGTNHEAVLLGALSGIREFLPPSDIAGVKAKEANDEKARALLVPNDVPDEVADDTDTEEGTGTDAVTEEVEGEPEQDIAELRSADDELPDEPLHADASSEETGDVDEAHSAPTLMDKLDEFVEEHETLEESGEEDEFGFDYSSGINGEDAAREVLEDADPATLATFGMSAARFLETHAIAGHLEGMAKLLEEIRTILSDLLQDVHDVQEQVDANEASLRGEIRKAFGKSRGWQAMVGSEVATLRWAVLGMRSANCPHGRDRNCCDNNDDDNNESM